MILEFSATYAAQLVIISFVQQDALVGTRQDWLMRPIARHDMLLAKLIFLIVTVRLPVFLFDFILARHHGAGLPAALGAATFNGFDALVGNDLITFAVAAVTENLLEAIVCVLLIGIVKQFGLAWLRPLLIGRRINPTWVSDLLREGLTVVALTSILLVQFFHRKTFAARALLGAGLLLLAGSACLPWGAAFAVEKMFYDDRSAGGTIAISYGGPRRLAVKVPFSTRDPFLYLPVHFANVPAHSGFACGKFPA